MQLKELVEAEKGLREAAANEFADYELQLYRRLANDKIAAEKNALQQLRRLNIDNEIEISEQLDKISKVTKKKDQKKQIKELADGNKEKIKAYKAYLKEIEKLDAEAAKKAADLVSQQKGLLGKFGIATGKTKDAQRAMLEKEFGKTGAEAESIIKKSNINAMAKAASNYLQQINGTIQNIGDMKSLVDTRLQGLNRSGRTGIRGALDFLSGKDTSY